ncbi:hypothetical protein PRUPE_6G334600 [Prunus persica]|uniref:FRIGIDA-like protein n=1 Tax=Prunus persica TaxID=3760 RepID=A0A251NZD8_PRUPE|nr:FRIGIDA-like protein 5 isoform X2 [Prunus persica]ONI04686.1 hypothetical protein PRUPE_6G334600 [Prunus persica]
MEKIASDLKMSETKQSCLGQAYEALHAQASSILHFGVQWKELEDHFESTRNSLQTRLRELENREKKIDDREKRLGALELNFDSEMASKAEKLRGVEKSIEEVESGKHHFNLQSLKLLIEEHNEELDVKEKRFSELQRLVGEKERECDLIDKRVKERTKKLNWVMKCVEERSREVESKKGEVEVVQGVLNKCREDIELQERQLNWMMGMIEERQKVYNLREEQINAAQIYIEECDDKMKLKMEELRLVQRSLEECSNTLESKENIIREMELKLRDFYLLKKSMEEWSSELEFKERELEGWFEKLELKEKQFEPQLEELHLMDKRINECLNEVQLQEKHLDSLQKSIQEREKNLDSLSYGLKLKERQLEQLAKELELKQKEVDWIRKSTETNTKKMRLKKKTNILDSQAKIEQLEHTPGNNATVPFSKSIQSRIYRNGRDLQLFLNEHLKSHDLLGTEISAILQASSDPAKLVLDAMQGFYPSNSVVENWECDFDLSVIRRSCILLLQELKRVSPQINPQVRGESKKLAGNWKDRMIVVVENWLEVLGFLLLLTTYDLTSTYDENELQSLLVVVSQHSLATELRQALGISESSIISSPVKIGEPISSLAKNGATCSLNLQPGAATDARNLQGFLNEHLNGNHSIQKEMSAALQTSSDPAKLVLDEIQTSFAQYWRKGDVGFDETFMFSNIALLEELMRVSRHVGPHLKEDAIKLAEQWKAKMRADTQNSLESLGFLQFVATYGLLPTLNGDEIKKLLGMIYQHKQALELCLTLGFADKIPDFIQNLIERKQLFEAFRFICTFKVNDKFSSVPLLKEYVEGARKSYRTTWRKKKSLDGKNEVVDHQIADLRAVIQCIEDYHLDSEYPSKDIEIQIVQLEKMKENWRKMAKSLGSKAEQEEKSLGFKAEQEEKSLGSKDGQGERSLAATQVEQEDKPLASKEKKPSISTSVSKVEQEDKSLASQEKKPSTSNSVSKVEQEDKSLASQQKKCSSIISASKVEQEDKSLASQKKKRSTRTSASKADQEEKKEKKCSASTPAASKAEQEEKKEKKCSTSTSSASKVEQEEKKEKKRSTSSCSSSKFEQRQQSKYKRPRTSATPYALPTFPRGYLQPSSSLLPKGNYGHHGHF